LPVVRITGALVLEVTMAWVAGTVGVCGT